MIKKYSLEAYQVAIDSNWFSEPRYVQLTEPTSFRNVELFGLTVELLRVWDRDGSSETKEMDWMDWTQIEGYVRTAGIQQQVWIERWELSEWSLLVAE